MATTIYKGHIAFGLVSFPVRLQAAARGQAVGFNQLHECDRSRVTQVLYCQAEDKPVSRSELVKGFEDEKDCYVVIMADIFSEADQDVQGWVDGTNAMPHLDRSLNLSPEGIGVH